VVEWTPVLTLWTAVVAEVKYWGSRMMNR